MRSGSGEVAHWCDTEGEVGYLRWLPVSRGVLSRDLVIGAGTGVSRTFSKDSWSEEMLGLIG